MEVRGNNNQSWFSQFPTINKVGDYWYHYMILIGAITGTNGKKYLMALNSWGNQVGNQGQQLFGEEWFTSHNIIDAFTWIHDSVVVPIPTPIAKQTIWQALALWFRQQWGLANSLTS
jgi:hypothetical protein